MKAHMKFKRVFVGLVAGGVLALSANAQAVTLDAGIFGSNTGDLGTQSNPVLINVNPPDSGIFLDTINFDLGTTNTLFNMTSTVSNITSFGAPIFENVNDTEVVAASPNHFSVFLPNLGLNRDYHLHPQGNGAEGSTYQLALWGSTAPVPVPAAVYLFGSGLIGLIGLARRKMKATA